MMKMKDKLLRWLCAGLLLGGIVLLFFTAAASDSEAIDISTVVLLGIVGLSMMFSSVVIGVSQGV